MKLDYTNPAHVKIALIADGIKIDPIFFNYFTDEYKSNNYIYSKDNNSKQRFPNYMLLRKDIICALNLDETSEWLLTVENKKFILQKNQQTIQEVDFEKKPKFYDFQLTEKIKGKDIASIMAPYCLSFFLNDTCFLFEKGKPCHFCGLTPTRNEYDEVIEPTPELVGQLIKHILKTEPELIKTIFFTGGTFADFDAGFSQLFAYLKAIKPLVPNNIPIEILNFPPKNPLLFAELKKLGADGVNFAIELANKERFAQYCPGKDYYYGWDKFVDIAIKASKYFPKRTFLNVVMGLDEETDLINFIEKMAKKGLMTSMNVFYPNPYSKMRNRKRPTKKYIYQVLKAQQQVFKNFDFKAFCPYSYRHGFDYEAAKQLI